jgi:hypothetical protein
MCVLNTPIIRVFTNIRVKFEAGARMILHAILLSIAKISEKRDPSQAVAILPEMRLGTENGVMIHHPISKHQAWLTGSVDHSIVQCEAEASNKGLLIFITLFSINFLCSEPVGCRR